MVGESLAVFLVLMVDIVIALLVGFIAYCLISKRVITRWGWTYKERDPGQYRKRLLIFVAVTLVLVIVRFLPLFDIARSTVD